MITYSKEDKTNWTNGKEEADGTILITRWANNQKTEVRAIPEHFGSDRAAEILQAGGLWSDFDKYMSDGEIAFVKKVWRRMPGYTSFYDALCRIKKGECPAILAECTQCKGAFYPANSLDVHCSIKCAEIAYKQSF